MNLIFRFLGKKLQKLIQGVTKKMAPLDQFVSFRSFLKHFFEISSNQLRKSIKNSLFGVRWECKMIKNNLLGGHF